MTVFLAFAETSRFGWMGVGPTEDEARDALLRAWAAHCAQHEVDPDGLLVDEIFVMPAESGQGYRDRSPLPRP